MDESVPGAGGHAQLGRSKRAVAIVYAAAAMILLVLEFTKLFNDGPDIDLGLHDQLAVSLLALVATIVIALFVAVRSVVSEQVAGPDRDFLLGAMAYLLYGLSIGCAAIGMSSVLGQVPAGINMSSLLIGGISLAVVWIACIGFRLVPDVVSRGQEELAKGRQAKITGRSAAHLGRGGDVGFAAVLWSSAMIGVPSALILGSLPLYGAKIDLGATVVVLLIVGLATVLNFAAVVWGIASMWGEMLLALLFSGLLVLILLGALAMGAVEHGVEGARERVIIGMWAGAALSWIVVLATGLVPQRGLRLVLAMPLAYIARKQAPSRPRDADGKMRLWAKKRGTELRAMVGRDESSDGS